MRPGSSLETGRPILVKDENLCDGLTMEPAHICEVLSPANEQTNYANLSFIRRANAALEKWSSESDELHRKCICALPFEIGLT